MRVLAEYLNGIIICLFELIIGILLLINPIGFTSGIIIAAGIILVFIGLVNCVKYFRAEKKEAAKGQFLTKGLIAIIAGAFCIFNSDWFIVTFSALTVIYGVVVLLSAVEKIQLSVDLLRQKRRNWYLSAISAAVSLVCAIIILKSPFSSTTILWIFAGISLILEAVFDMYSLMANRRNKEENIKSNEMHEEKNSDTNFDIKNEEVRTEETKDDEIRMEETEKEDLDEKKNRE